MGVAEEKVVDWRSSLRAPVAAKVCTKCKVSKPLSAFHRDSEHKTGRSYRCKECALAYSKAYYERKKKRWDHLPG